MCVAGVRENNRKKKGKNEMGVFGSLDRQEEEDS